MNRLHNTVSDMQKIDKGDKSSNWQNNLHVLNSPPELSMNVLNVKLLLYMKPTNLKINSVLAVKN